MTGVGSAAGGAARQRYPLARAIQLLNVMIESEATSFGVRQLAAELDVSASTAHRLLGDLEGLGLISRSSEGNYRIGLEFYRLAWLATARFPLRQAANESLREVSRATGETAFLGVYDDLQHRMMFAATVESRHPLRYVMELNRWLPLHSGASGQAILAFLSDDVLRELVDERPLPAVTEHTITDPRALRRTLDAVRGNGYAFSRGQRIPGALAIAAPVFGPHGGVVGDVGITMPDNRFSHHLEGELAAEVKAAAAAVTARIGGDAARRDGGG